MRVFALTHAMHPKAWAAILALATSCLHSVHATSSSPRNAELAPAAAAAATLAWQLCTSKPDAERLSCFDEWARGQQALLQVVEEKARSVAESPMSVTLLRSAREG